MTRAGSSRTAVSSADQAVGGDAHLGVIRLSGEHDLATVSALAATLSQAVAADDADVVVDFREVAFMDGSTIGVIVVVRTVAATERAGRRDGVDAAPDHGGQVPVLPGPAADSGRRETDSEATAKPGAR